MLKSGVYRIDLGNGWFYVGSACDLKRREGQHRSDLERKKHRNRIVQNVFNKYGAFEFIVLGRHPIDEILRYEQELLDEHCPHDKCANIATTAGSRLGVKHSDSARAKMSAASKNMSPTHRARLSAARMGKRHSDATRAKMRAATAGKRPAVIARLDDVGRDSPFTDAHRAALSAARLGRKHTDATRAKMRSTASARYARRALVLASQISA